MMNYDYSSPVAQPEYHAQFWDMLGIMIPI